MIVPLVLFAGLIGTFDDCPKKQADTAIPPRPPARINTFIQTLPEGVDAQIEMALRTQGVAGSETQKKTRAELRAHQAEIREAMRQAQKELDKAGVTKQWIANPEFSPGFSKAFYNFGGPEPRICLDIDELPIRDAIKRVFKTTKFEYSFDDDVAKDVKVTLKAPNVRLSTALDMITDAGNVSWTREMRINPEESAPVIHYRIRKTAPREQISLIHRTVDGAPKIIDIGGPGKLFSSGTSEKFSFGVLMPEVRSKIECPHCHGKVVAYRPKVVERCEKCGGKYPEGKNICPADGTRRPTPPKPWKYCPLCGKPVDYRD